MKQNIKVNTTLGGGCYSLYLRQVYEEFRRIVVILETYEPDMTTLEVLQISANLNVETNNVRVLPVVFFNILSDNRNLEKIKKLSSTTLPSEHQITIKDQAVCLYDGRIQLGRSTILIKDGQATQLSENQGKVSELGRFAPTKNAADITPCIIPPCNIM